MENMAIYEKVREVPENAKREIPAGRLKGKTDINPMWRIKTLTEQFGVCGIGWRYEITDKRMELSPETNEIAAFMDINLYIKVDGEWSEAIPGTGGNVFVVEEKNGFRVNDDCYKMALTDAISVACKAIGVGADVYWSDDETKYDEPTEKTEKKPSDVWKMQGAATADNKTLFVNALKIAGLTNEQGGEILKKMFGDKAKINDLTEIEMHNLIAALE